MSLFQEIFYDLCKAKEYVQTQEPQMKLATEAEAAEIHAEVKKWWSGTAKTAFASCGGVSKRTVAEFIANSKGLTLYAYLLEK